MRGRLEAAEKRYALVASRFNEEVVRELVQGAHGCLVQHGASDNHIDTIWVPGAWELPYAVRLAAGTGRYAAIVALGCVIRGETPHFDFIAGEAARGLAELAVSERIPVTFGVLTTENLEQAYARAGGPAGNKGWEAALSAIELSNLGAEFGGGHAGA
jgi:6,7-dimethyl-8-ribityllumazine synthase